MKISQVFANPRKGAFEVRTRHQTMLFPFAAVGPSPTREDPVISVAVDPELGHEGFTYTLRSGAEGVVHIDHVLEYNRDPAYLSRQMVYELTLVAEKAVAASPLSTRELTRRLKTSASQFYRLLDPTNSKKSLAQLLELLGVLDCDIDLSVRYGERSKRQEKLLGFSPVGSKSAGRVPPRMPRGRRKGARASRGKSTPSRS